MSTETSAQSCWGRFELEASERGHWRIGPLTLWIERTADEWRVATKPGDDPWDETFFVECPLPPSAESPPEDVTWHRFGFKATESAVVVTPRVSDRAVVSRPEMPVTLPPGQSGRYFVGSPAWIDVRPEGAAQAILDAPTFRPSDTWFGSTQEGSLSYATRTRLRRDLSKLPRLRQRVITPVQIENDASDSLVLERLSLPVTHLSVFEAEDGHLWTEPVRLRRESSEETGAVEIGSGPPNEAKGATRLSGPREEHDDVFVSRLFGRLFD